jgi:hypothetical protein
MGVEMLSTVRSSLHAISRAILAGLIDEAIARVSAALLLLDDEDHVDHVDVRRAG